MELSLIVLSCWVTSSKGLHQRLGVNELFYWPLTRDNVETEVCLYCQTFKTLDKVVSWQAQSLTTVLLQRVQQKLSMNPFSRVL